MDSLQNFESFVFTDGTFDQAALLVGAPSTGVTSLAFSADTGVSNSDFITNTAAQTISGVLDANLANGETVEVSLDNGITWTTATSSVGTNTFSLSGQTLVGSDALLARVSNIAGDGTAASQAYVLDSFGPRPAGDPDALGWHPTAGRSATASPTTRHPRLPAPPKSAPPSPCTTPMAPLCWAPASPTAAAITASPRRSLTGGTHTLTVKAEDTAGNIGVASSGLALTIDASAPGQPSAPDARGWIR